MTDGVRPGLMAQSRINPSWGGTMKLAIAGVVAACWGLAGLPALAQTEEAPALRTDQDAAPAESGTDETAFPEDPALTREAEIAAALEAAMAESRAVAEARAEAAEIAAAAAAEAAAEAGSDAEAGEAAAAPAAVAAVPEDKLIRAAADYALFQRDLAAVKQRPIDEPVDLDAIMDTLASYDSRTLNDAWLSYAAFIAAQQPAFVDKVREVADYYGVAELVQGMVNEPEYVLGFPGAREAAAVVLRVLRDDAAALEAMSERFKQESYTLQQRGWSNLIARDRPARLDVLANPRRITTPTEDLMAAVAFGAPIASTAAPEDARMRRIAFWSAVDYRPEPNGAAGLAQPGEAKAIGPMMTLAALRVLDVSQDRPDLVDHLLNLPKAKDCLDFALLHLRQCIAAARFKYEDAFCIAEHQLEDMGECLGATVADTRRRPAIPAPMIAAAEQEAAADETAETAAPRAEIATN